MNCARRVAWERTRAVLKPVATNGSIGRREARALCMMFMQDGDGVRSVRKVASARYRLRAPTSEPAARQWLVGSVSASSIQPCRLGRPWTEGAAAIGTAPAVCEKPTTFSRFDPPRAGPRLKNRRPPPCTCTHPGAKRFFAGSMDGWGVAMRRAEERCWCCSGATAVLKGVCITCACRQT